ncbi:MAG: VCBS repeat-containing protein, partial [Acidobacteriota bacterium]
SNGTWYLNRSQLGFTGIQFGIATDLPVAADYDGDGRADVAVYRSGVWYLNRTTAGFTGVQFGTPTDRPVPNAFVP